MSVDCLAGPTPYIPVMIPAEQEPGVTPPFKHYHDRVVSIDRQHQKAPADSIVFYGDSIVEGFPLNLIQPAGVLNFGIASDTMRGMLNRLGRPNDVLHRAAAGIMLIGINDICYEGSNAYLNCTFMWDLLAQWMTGKWVIVKVLPINESMFHSTTNAVIDSINAYIDTKFSGRSGFAVVDTKPVLAPTGQLDPAYTPDGLHPTNAYDLIAPMISSALASIL